MKRSFIFVLALMVMMLVSCSSGAKPATPAASQAAPQSGTADPPQLFPSPAPKALPSPEATKPFLAAPTPALFPAIPKPTAAPLPVPKATPAAVPGVIYGSPQTTFGRIARIDDKGIWFQLRTDEIMLSSAGSQDFEAVRAALDSEKNINRSIKLFQGWNLIGVPWAVDLIIGAPLRQFKEYSWFRAWYYLPLEDRYYGSNYLLPGWGYWVESEDQHEEIIQGWGPDVTIQLAKGWNLISVPVEITVQELEKQVRLKASEGYKAWFFRPQDNKYFGTDILTPGIGYWIETEAVTTITFSTRPVLWVEPASLDFGIVAVGKSKDLSFGIYNAGGGILKGTVETENPFKVVSSNSFSLAGDQGFTMTIRFTPLAAMKYEAEINFASNALTGFMIQFKGTGVRPE